MAMCGTNWAGNHTYRAGKLAQPTSIDELRGIVATSNRVHALGSRHSFNAIADSDTLISLDNLDPAIRIDRDRRTVSVGGGVRYGTLALALEREGFALHNMASLPHISVAGAVSTGTHGSGDRHGNLATAVSDLELVTSHGDILKSQRGDPDFDGLVVNIGALGVVTRLTLDIEPSYQVCQEVFEHLAWDVLVDEFDAITVAADSVSVFLDWGDPVGSLWLKTRVDPGDTPRPRTERFGARAATRQRHPMETMPGEGCTEQLGVAGPWLHRLPHFRMEAAPASGHEIQSEFMVARPHAIAAITALRTIHDAIQPHLFISEIRTVAADNFWLSSAYGTETVCLHFSWKPDMAAVERILPVVEDALAPFSPRPHWGKVFTANAAALESRYPKMADFRALVTRLDPRGAFRNDFLERHVLENERMSNSE